MKQIKSFDTFINEGSTYDDLNGYTMQGNKEKQMGSGFIVGDDVQIEYKNLRGDVIQSIPAVVTEVWSRGGDWAVIVKKENGHQVFGTDTSKFTDLSDLVNLTA